VPYVSRGRRSTSVEQSHVYECIRLLSAWSSALPLPMDLMTSIQSWPRIGGYIGAFDKVLLTDLLDVDFAAEWGSLVKVCSDSSKADSFRLKFLFAAMSFRNDISLDNAMTLIAFATIDALKLIPLPDWGSFTQVKLGEKPQASHIREVIIPCLIPFVSTGDKWRRDVPQ
jgi:hypothetical protein